MEIWNEPPWSGDLWDIRNDLFDVWPGSGTPGPKTRNIPNFGFVGNLQNKKLPAGITLTWGGTEKSGSNSILDSSMYANTGVYATQPVSAITAESFHPYGNEPEQMMYDSSCLQGTIKSYPNSPAPFTNCYLPGEPTGPNFILAMQEALVAMSQNPTYGVGHNITETGILPPAAGLRMGQARFIMRQYLGYQALGITPVEFYRLYDPETPSDPSYGFVNYSGGTSYTPYPAYTAIAGLMADVKPISNLPVSSNNTSNLPSIAKYNGSFPLTSVNIIGSRAGASVNSIMFVVWQRSYTNNVWIQMASPPAGQVAVNIPSGMNVTTVINLDTRSTVNYTGSGQQISFGVADDPIEILLDPN